MINSPIPYTVTFLLLTASTVPALADEYAAIQFDTLSATAARQVEPPEDAYVPPKHVWVKFDLDVSALIDSTQSTTPFEFLYHVACRSHDVKVVDYSPRTELNDTSIGGVTVEESNEASKNLGLQLSGAFEMVRASGGGDLLTKSINKTKVERIAPQEIVSASGTVLRGRGVYFKLRSTPTHVLDGGKKFQIMLQVPETWRAELLDLKISGSQSVRGSRLRDDEVKVTNRARFLIAVFKATDDVARRWAWDLSEAEQMLHESVSKYAYKIRRKSFPTVFHQVAAALDVIEPKISEDWMSQTLFGTIDPYFDEDIRNLPVKVRAAVLDYLDAKSNFLSLVDYSPMSQEAHSDLAVNR